MSSEAGGGNLLLDMASKYPIFDVSRLSLEPLAQRENIVKLDDILPLTEPPGGFSHPALPELAGHILSSRGKASVILMIGATSSRKA